MSTDNWQRRWQPLLDQWVLISARSAARPWSGAMAQPQTLDTPEHDPGCYLCPRVTRANGVQNPDYSGAYAFDNDFPSLALDAPHAEHTHPLEQTAAATGICRVLCWSERHDATLADLSVSEIQQVVQLWQREYTTLSQNDAIHQVLIFENKGHEIGVSNLHPHGQIYATGFISDTAERMRSAQVHYAQSHPGQSLLQDMLNLPHTREQLTVDTGEHWRVIVPFAARFAYETWIIPNRHVRSLAQMHTDELNELAVMYQQQVQRYDRLFMRSAPNITLLHNAPCDGMDADNQHWCFHLAFQPPLRDPEKMKFLAGFESGANNIVNPVQPEQAAEQLRRA